MVMVRYCQAVDINRLQTDLEAFICVFHFATIVMLVKMYDAMELYWLHSTEAY